MLCAFMLRTGSLVGSYRIASLLAEGAIGAVYEGVSELVARRVAIKVLPPEAAAQPDIVRSFFHEAWVASQIDHPALVQVIDQGTLADGTAYLVTERLKDDTLAQRLRQGPLPVSDALSLCWQIASALTAAHERDIVHGDLTPASLMMIPDPLVPGRARAKILDWGASALRTGPAAGLAEGQPAMGTPTYMSPEQCRGDVAVGPKTDVYALGVILFELLAGRPPFVAETANEVQGLHLHYSPPSLAQLQPAIPDDVVSLVDSLLAKEPSERPTMAELGQRLDALLRARRRTPPSQRTLLPPPEPTSGPTADLETLSGPRPDSGGLALAIPRSGRPNQPEQWTTPQSPVGWMQRPAVLGIVGCALATVVGLGVVLLRRAEPPAEPARLIATTSGADPVATRQLSGVRSASPSLLKVEALSPQGVVVEPLAPPATVAAPPPAVEPAPSAPPSTLASRPPDESESRRTPAQEALHRARRLLVHKKYMSALVEARNAIALGHQAGWGIVGEVACIRGDLTLAHEANLHATTADQKRIWTACQKNGLSAP